MSAEASQSGEEIPKKPISVDPRRVYSVAQVVDAVQSGDLALIVDAARLYPALVLALIIDPILLFRSLYGHKKARRAELGLKNLFYLERRTMAEKSLARNLDGIPYKSSAGGFGAGSLPEIVDVADEARDLLEKLKNEEPDD